MVTIFKTFQWRIQGGAPGIRSPPTDQNFMHFLGKLVYWRLLLEERILSQAHATFWENLPNNKLVVPILNPESVLKLSF